MGYTLTASLQHYYDFLVAYENLLRDNVYEVPLTIHSSDWVLFSSQSDQGKIWIFSKEKADSAKVVHFINFFDANTMEWRDTAGNQTEPINRGNLTVTVQEERSVKKVWIASPDSENGLPITLDFEQRDGSVTFTLPSLKYWDMVVLEYN
ncbi:hypothetical protein J9303_19430 [Bacillaceae bacterium Marseille-Q3522]|nr:hypothetical protein [Bacillaceae bacterium Marseille-Q3522]